VGTSPTPTSILVFIGLLLAACDAAPTPPPCRFRPDHILATTTPRVDALDLALEVRASGLPRRGYVVWSAHDGTFARLVAASGAPLAATLRLGPPCAGGLSATQTSDGNAWIACLRRGNASKDDPGGVALWRITNGSAQLHASFGSAGMDAIGLALVAEARDLVVLWQDATPGAHRIMRAEVPRDVAGAPYADAIQPRPVSLDELVGTGPTLVLHQGRAVAGWAEYGFDATGGTLGRVLVDGAAGAAVEVAQLGFDLPMPRLAENGVGGLALAYRDTASLRDKAGLYVVALGDRLRPIGSPRRIARANGPGPATLTACSGSMFAVAPRTYQRDILVGLTRLTPDLTARGREQQVYEDTRAIAQAALGCTSEGPLLVTGEQGTAAWPDARLRATTLECAER
jgi:hypothetical protein